MAQPGIQPWAEKIKGADGIHRAGVPRTQHQEGWGTHWEPWKVNDWWNRQVIAESISFQTGPPFPTSMRFSDCSPVLPTCLGCLISHRNRVTKACTNCRQKKIYSGMGFLRSIIEAQTRKAKGSAQERARLAARRALQNETKPHHALSRKNWQVMVGHWSQKWTEVEEIRKVDHCWALYMRRQKEGIKRASWPLTQDLSWLFLQESLIAVLEPLCGASPRGQGLSSGEAVLLPDGAWMYK